MSKHHNSLECRVPSVDFGDEPISVTSPKEVHYGFLMDGVSQLKNLSANPQFRPLLYFPNPVVRPFSEEKNTKKYKKGDMLVIEVRKICFFFSSSFYLPRYEKSVM